MKTLVLPTLLLLTLGLLACSKEKTENTQVAAEQTEVVADTSINDSEAQPLDAAPLEDDSVVASEAASE